MEDDKKEETHQYIQGLAFVIAAVVEHLTRPGQQPQLAAILEATQEETQHLPTGQAIRDVLNHAKALREAIDAARSERH